MVREARNKPLKLARLPNPRAVTRLNGDIDDRSTTVHAGHFVSTAGNRTESFYELRITSEKSRYR
jgi:hypothetical protein